MVYVKEVRDKIYCDSVSESFMPKLFKYRSNFIKEMRENPLKVLLTDELLRGVGKSYEISKIAEALNASVVVSTVEEAKTLASRSGKVKYISHRDAIEARGVSSHKMKVFVDDIGHREYSSLVENGYLILGGTVRSKDPILKTKEFI